MPAPIQVGGSFACPLTDDLLAKYEALANAAEQSIKDAMLCLLNCCKQWWNLPDSSSAKVPHLSGRASMTPLDETNKKALYDHIPWEDELKVFADRFETISNDTNKELRDAAHHLLWHVVELNLDREPITTDKVG
jgi:hypothetical protein